MKTIFLGFWQFSFTSWGLVKFGIVPQLTQANTLTCSSVTFYRCTGGQSSYSQSGCAKNLSFSHRSVRNRSRSCQDAQGSCQGIFSSETSADYRAQWGM